MWLADFCGKASCASCISNECTTKGETLFVSNLMRDCSSSGITIINSEAKEKAELINKCSVKHYNECCGLDKFNGSFEICCFLVAYR
jgi:hypothetical protein